ncbi:MAG: glycosyl transferase group 1, partial [uncultured bacterium]
MKKILFWRNIKLISDFHGSLTKEMVSHSYLNGGLFKKIFFAIEKWIDNLGDEVFTSSEENSKEISSIRRGGDVSTVLDGANLSYYENISSKEDLRKEFELPLDKVIVTYTGALMFNKGIEYLLNAIPEVLK